MNRGCGPSCLAFKGSAAPTRRYCWEFPEPVPGSRPASWPSGETAGFAASAAVPGGGERRGAPVDPVSSVRLGWEESPRRTVCCPAALRTCKDWLEEGLIYRHAKFEQILCVNR